VDGELARAGRPDDALVGELLADPFFDAPPPKSTGRERFGAPRARRILDRAGSGGPGAGADAVATALWLTVRAIAGQIGRWLPAGPGEVVGSGGGMRNPALRSALERALAPRPLRSFDDLFFDGDAKEAVCAAHYSACETARATFRPQKGERWKGIGRRHGGERIDGVYSATRLLHYPQSIAKNNLSIPPRLIVRTRPYRLN
jgi:1,6-anhydro-N-acetylmuramate kinase